MLESEGTDQHNRCHCRKALKLSAGEQSGRARRSTSSDRREAVTSRRPCRESKGGQARSRGVSWRSESQEGQARAAAAARQESCRCPCCRDGRLDFCFDQMIMLCVWPCPAHDNAWVVWGCNAMPHPRCCVHWVDSGRLSCLQRQDQWSRESVGARAVAALAPPLPNRGY